MSKYDLSEQSPMLSAFYAAYVKWVESGEQPEKIPCFHTSTALCGALHDFSDGDRAFLIEIQQQFIEAGLSGNFPFNEGEWPSFDTERSRGLLHTNPKRLAWARDHVLMPVNQVIGVAGIPSTSSM